MRARLSHLRGHAGQAGQTAAETMGVLLVVAAIIGAIVASDVDAKIVDGVRVALCRILGGSCTTEDAATADGQPRLSECVRSSSQRGISGAVKIAFVKFGAGVEGIKEVRADGTVKVTIKGNAKAGLEFGGPGVEAEGGGAEAGGGSTEVSITGKGEYGRGWVFPSEDAADDFIGDVTKKVTAIADPRPNLPFTDDDADIELPEHDETTYAGGVEVRAKGKLGGAGLEGNLGVGGGAIFNEDEDSPDYGDKTYFFEVDAGASADTGGALFAIGGSGQGKTRIAITYDRDGKEKSMKVIGQFDATATDSLRAAIDGKDLDGFLSRARTVKASGTGEAGARVIFTADLDLRDPENLAAAQAFIQGRDPRTGEPVSRIDSAGALYERFRDESRVNARFYSLSKDKVGGELDLGVFAVSGEYTSEDAQLVDAYYRSFGEGGFTRWDECVLS
ncbi:MAG TPA: hypothetical protein VF533_09275 [Solirubrobacteraceae bacterium]|jgi:hypothetical protein